MSSIVACRVFSLARAPPRPAAAPPARGRRPTNRIERGYDVQQGTEYAAAAGGALA